MTRTPAQVAEFNAEVARLRAARIARDIAPARDTASGHFDRVDQPFLYLGRAATPAARGITCVLRGSTRVQVVVAGTGRVLDTFGSAARFWAQRIPA